MKKRKRKMVKDTLVPVQLASNFYQTTKHANQCIHARGKVTVVVIRYARRKVTKLSASVKRDSY